MSFWKSIRQPQFENCRRIERLSQSRKRALILTETRTHQPEKRTDAWRLPASGFTHACERKNIGTAEIDQATNRICGCRIGNKAQVSQSVQGGSLFARDVPKGRDAEKSNYAPEILDFDSTINRNGNNSGNLRREPELVP
jgi:hypothetical protein